MKMRTSIALGMLLAPLVVACSKNDAAMPETPDADTGRDTGDAAPPMRERPAGPVADVSEELTGGSGPFIAASGPLGAPDGYVDHEYVAAGTATSYTASGTLTDDGNWTFTAADSAAYRTRVLVRRPAKNADASGTVIVEWLNVSGGADANPDYASLSEELVRQGHTWVGVSAQLIGVEGGPVLVAAPGGESVAGKGLKTIDAARYGSLKHPGDGYSFDIFTQVARAVVAGGALLGGGTPKFVIAAGESQSAFALTTYYDGVQPLTRVFDGFFVHSRGGGSLPLVAPGAYADIAGAIGSATHPVLRGDLDAPVMDIQTEGDLTGLLNSSVVRQPDTERFRLWEVTGTSHADAHLVGSLADTIDCGVPINRGPMHLVAKAAFRALESWVRTGATPLIAPRLELAEDAGMTALARDPDGIALGGIRTPPVDVPVDVLSGAPGPSTDVICLLLGSTTPLPAARLAALYASRAAYQNAYDADADKTISAGFVLSPDRDALLGFAEPSLIPE